MLLNKEGGLQIFCADCNATIDILTIVKKHAGLHSQLGVKPFR